MAEFLTAAWLAELDDAARGASGLADAAEEPVVVEHRVGFPDEHVVVYHLVLGPGPARVHPGPAAMPDLVLVTTAEAAEAIRRGAANAQQCLADGSLRLRGNPEVLTRRVAVLAGIGDLLAAARR